MSALDPFHSFIVARCCYHGTVTNRPLHGVVPALVTPFKENERIDYGAWQVMIDMLIAAGVHGLFVAGSQGEFYALDMEERTVAMRFCKQAIAGRVPVYANVGCITTRDTVALALQAQALDVDAIVVVTPYYMHAQPAGTGRSITSRSAAPSGCR